MFESCESTIPLEAHESISSLELESNKGDKHAKLEIDTNKNKVPELGQVFASEEEAYEFYNAYGRKEGFSIRKDKIERRRNGKVYLRHFACSKGGHRKNDRRRVNVKKRRAETRTGCMARLVIRLNDDDTWVVKVFIADHNHPVVSPPRAHLLRSQRRLRTSHVARIIDFEDVGVPPADGIELMAKEVGRKENLDITELDYRNFLRAMKTMKKNQVGKGEAQRVMDYFKRMQLENPSFFYAVQFLKMKPSLPEVLFRYEKVLTSGRAKELEADFDSSQTSPALYINAPMLKQVAKEYTREVFEKFQKEFQKFILYNVENCGVDGSIQKYKVTKIEGDEECLVTLDVSNNEVLCSCKKFEFVGIQCKHVMKVLNYNNIHAFPSKYILKRWTKDARVGAVKNIVGNSVQGKPNTSMRLRYGNICRMAVNLATRGAVSEEAHLVAINGLEKALEDVEAILKKTQTASHNNSIRKMNDGQSPMDVTLTLAQGNERDRPTDSRMKSCLESGRGRKRSEINLHGNSGINTDQITRQEYDDTHAFQEPYHASGLQQPSFLPYLGSFQVPFQCLGISIPSIAPLGGTSTAHVELIQPTNSLGGHLPPASIG
ncbi:hypothetical protein HHK36_001897 [Tetracentron sinense]|uniref:Protein FAR1-RELATED SEQUENCE n=1 Tax=Tetracentron sinense TaxID=13715 RepID=A0A835A3J0_TETSI|nr:hypothetical protein HHK36_001897 [Tetracentron sinense]